jgi:hypothetical protein
MQRHRVAVAKALLTNEEHFYTLNLAHPITINCDSSSGDDENYNNNDGADNEGSEVDKNTHDNYPYMISHSTTLYPCRRRE